jgi:hypothetical protein
MLEMGCRRLFLGLFGGFTAGLGISSKPAKRVSTPRDGLIIYFVLLYAGSATEMCCCFICLKIDVFIWSVL